MKKILSIFAALAMLAAFVGCECEIVVQFNEQTVVFDNAKINKGESDNSAYPIDRWEIVSGDDVIKIESTTATVTGEPTLPREVKITSLAEGNAKVDFYSDLYAKKALSVTITVNSLGNITGYSDLKDYTYRRSSALASVTTKWQDNPGANVLDIPDGVYTNNGNSNNMLIVEGNIVYQLCQYQAYGTTLKDFFRLVLSEKNGRLSVIEDSNGGYTNINGSNNYGFNNESAMDDDDTDGTGYVDLHNTTPNWSSITGYLQFLPVSGDIITYYQLP